MVFGREPGVAELFCQRIQWKWTARTGMTQAVSDGNSRDANSRTNSWHPIQSQLHLWNVRLRLRILVCGLSLEIHRGISWGRCRRPRLSVRNGIGLYLAPLHPTPVNVYV